MTVVRKGDGCLVATGGGGENKAEKDGLDDVGG